MVKRQERTAKKSDRDATTNPIRARIDRKKATKPKKVHLSKRQIAASELLNKCCRLWTASPMYKLDFRRSKPFVECVKLQLMDSLKLTCKVTVDILEDAENASSSSSNEWLPLFKIQVVAEHSITAIMQCYLFSLRNGPNCLSNFQSLPLLITRGNLAVAKVVLEALSMVYDCSIRARQFTSLELLSMLAEWIPLEDSATSPIMLERKHNKVDMTFKFPEKISGLSTCSVSFPIQAGKEINDLMVEYGDARNFGSDTNAFLISLYEHIGARMKINCRNLTLKAFKMPAAGISANGCCKITSMEHMSSIVKTLCLACEKDTFLPSVMLSQSFLSNTNGRH